VSHAKQKQSCRRLTTTARVREIAGIADPLGRLAAGDIRVRPTGSSLFSTHGKGPCSESCLVLGRYSSDCLNGSRSQKEKKKPVGCRPELDWCDEFISFPGYATLPMTVEA